MVMAKLVSPEASAISRREKTPKIDGTRIDEDRKVTERSGS